MKPLESRDVTPNQEGIVTQPIEITSPDGQIMLRQYVPEDAAEGFALIDRNRDHLSQFGDETANKYKTVEDFTESILHPKNPQRLRFGIRSQNGELVGSINLTPDEDNLQRGEIGYYLGAEYQGHGYMGRAVQTLTEFAFAQLGYQTVYGKVVSGNVGSIAVLQKAGYTETGNDGDTVILTRKKQITV